jgi:hypothetical protein
VCSFLQHPVISFFGPNILLSTCFQTPSVCVLSLTFNVLTFKSSGTCCSMNFNGPKSLKLQTFRKYYTFSVLCNIEIWTKNSLKDNKIFYTYTKE